MGSARAPSLCFLKKATRSRDRGRGPAWSPRRETEGAPASVRGGHPGRQEAWLGFAPSEPLASPSKADPLQPFPPGLSPRAARPAAGGRGTSPRGSPRLSRHQAALRSRLGSQGGTPCRRWTVDALRFSQSVCISSLVWWKGLPKVAGGVAALGPGDEPCARARAHAPQSPVGQVQRAPAVPSSAGGVTVALRVRLSGRSLRQELDTWTRCARWELQGWPKRAKAPS